MSLASFKAWTWTIVILEIMLLQVGVVAFYYAKSKFT